MRGQQARPSNVSIVELVQSASTVYIYSKGAERRIVAKVLVREKGNNGTNRKGKEQAELETQ